MKNEKVNEKKFNKFQIKGKFGSFRLNKESAETKFIRQIFSMGLKHVGFNREELKIYFLVPCDVLNEMVNDSSITVRMVKDSSITVRMVKDSSITDRMVKDSSITTEMVKDSSITTEMVKDSSITSILEAMENEYRLLCVDLKNWDICIAGNQDD